ncbi:hypothetical protein Hdeb2414_s0086g00785041 [Helianthus debilis subsp. tardiflorus]
MMVHKFMSYFGVPLNGSFAIEQTFVIFIVFHLRSKTLFISFIFNRKSYEICLKQTFGSTSLDLHLISNIGDTCSITIIELFQSLRHLVVSV